jgi:hypothetical protein
MDDKTHTSNTPSHGIEAERPAEATKDLEPEEQETEQVKGGPFSWGASAEGADLQLKYG